MRTINERLGMSHNLYTSNANITVENVASTSLKIEYPSHIIYLFERYITQRGCLSRPCVGSHFPTPYKP